MANQRPNPTKRYRSHSMERLLRPDPPLRKRYRNHSIDFLLRPEPPIVQRGAGHSQQPLQHYVKQLEDNIEHNAKFKLIKCSSKFSIENVPADPEGLLADIFQHCVDRAVENSRKNNCEPDEFGCMISSELLNTDIWIPVRPLTKNTVDAILNRFLLVGQSKEQENVTLWGKPFTVSVTAINRKALPSKQIKGGSAYKKKIAAFHHRIPDNCLIKVIWECCEKFRIIFTFYRSIILPATTIVFSWHFKRHTFSIPEGLAD